MPPRDPGMFEPRPPGAIEHAQAAASDAVRLLRAHVELALVEAESVGKRWVLAVAVAVLVGLVAFTAWAAAAAAIVLALVERGLGWAPVLIGVAIVNILIAVGLVFLIKNRLASLAFPATLRQLRATLGRR